MLDITMTKLRSLVERTGIALFLVSHLRRAGGDINHEEGEESHWDSYVAQLQSLSYQIQSSHWSEINKTDLNTLIQQLEYLKIDILAKLASHQRLDMT